jgi:3-hydroxy acid dehydrogenase/malonic semialdehyde reductase
MRTEPITECLVQGMTVAVTGATSGFGEEIARSFSRLGARVVLIGRRADRLTRLAAELGADDAHVLCADIRDAPSYAEALRQLPEAFSSIDILVNNAGVGLGRDLAQEARLSDWLGMVETNVTGLIAGTHAVLPGMVERNSGHIVNIGASAAQFPTPRNAIYAATKAFVRQFSLCLRADLLGTQIRVTDVEPAQAGGTEFTLVRSGGNQQVADSMYAGIAVLTPRDVADAVQWVASRPAHVNINLVQLMPVDQGFAPPAFARKQGAPTSS